MPRYYVSESSPICRSGQSSIFGATSTCWRKCLIFNCFQHALIKFMWWYCAGIIAVYDPGNYFLRTVAGNRVVLVCSTITHAWVVSKVFFVTSFGVESRKISVYLLVLDLPSYMNSFQFLVCVHVLLAQDTTHAISQMGTCEKDRLFSPPLLLLRLSRK